MEFVCFNGNFLPANKPLFTKDNRSFRYGDGLFETMKVHQSKILLQQFHYDRLILGLKMLQIESTLDVSELSRLILDLCQKNNCIDLARVRLAVYRNQENKSEFVIEAFPLSKEINQWREIGLTIDLYPYARKSPDAFSNFKTANFLPYVLAENYAKEKGLDDAIVLNAFNLICDSSKANIFLVKDNEIFTPALHQGCISGVMRRFVIDFLKSQGVHVRQQEISEKELYDADEVFLTNIIHGIKWVQFFRERIYAFELTFGIHQIVSTTLYP
jgi:branched-chain amino acid aminotransferase